MVRLIRLDKILFLSILFLHSFAFAQVPSQKELLRVQIWSEMDSFPGGLDEAGSEPSSFHEVPKASSSGMYDFAVARTKEIAPFLLSGMISGWNFDYVPYDKTRHVSEEFEFEEVIPYSRHVNPITYKNPVVEDEKLLCWAYCNRTESQQMAYRRWNAIAHPKVHGIGKSSVENGFEGIKQACADAMKNAVREYWRIYIKNKPKEIYGMLLLIGVPRVYISEGQYVADLEFFMETDKIVKYTYY
ncbi:MAG: hypothetical protein K6G00_11365 [Treponema sp.]|nr:hypothetical protein [Treponema sp.]